MPIDIVYTRIGHLASVADSPELRAAYNASIGEITDFYSSIRLDDALYARFAEYAESPEGASLKGERARMLSEIMLDFELGGAKLPEREKKRIREIDSLLAVKTQKFSENVLDDTKAFSLDIEDPADLSGLPPTAVAVAAATASAEGKKGWTFTLDQPSYVPFMSYADNDALREKLWRASARLASDGKYSNAELMPEILKLRAEKAKILGRNDFADLILERRMARNGKRRSRSLRTCARNLRVHLLRNGRSSWTLPIPRGSSTLPKWRRGRRRTFPKNSAQRSTGSTPNRLDLISRWNPSWRECLKSAKGFTD